MEKEQEQVAEDFMSVQYLMQIYSEKGEFRKDKASRIMSNLFSEDSKKDRYLDPRDILIKTGNKTLALVCTKSEYQN